MHNHIMMIVGGHSDDVSVFAFEGGTGDHDAMVRLGSRGYRGGEASCGGVSEADEPVPSIGVGEGVALRHFLLVGIGVVLSTQINQLKCN